MKSVSIVFIILATLFTFNPNRADHKTEIIDAAANESFLIGQASKLAVEFITYDDHLLFSTTRMENTIISFGVMGKVFVQPIEINSKVSTR